MTAPTQTSARANKPAPTPRNGIDTPTLFATINAVAAQLVDLAGGEQRAQDRQPRRRAHRIDGGPRPRMRQRTLGLGLGLGLGSDRFISAGDSHICGVTTGGTVRCWGDDEYAQSSPPPELALNR